jgi:hypothetical protein
VRRGIVLAIVLGMLLLFSSPAMAAEFEKYGIESVGASLSTNQAGDHPEFDTSFRMKTDGVGFPFAQTRDVEVDLPPGLLANLAAFPRCTVLQFQSEGCPFESQLGIVEINAYALGSFIEPLYQLSPGPDGVARLAFYAAIYPNVINVRVRSESDYGASAVAEGLLSAFPPVEVTTTIWAVPADKSHDALRITPEEANEGKAPPNGGRPSNLAPRPLTVNPTHCDGPLPVLFTATSYQLPFLPSSMSASIGPISGCGKLGFTPSFSATPSTREASAPSGLTAVLKLPQNEAVNGLATSHLRHARVTFPSGMTIAPGAAEGQLACSDAEAGYRSRRPAACPAASKLGEAEIDVPALERPLQGGLYLRTPEPGNLFRVWLIADDLGAHLALPGELEVDKATGQITSAFLEMPQAPVREARVEVFGGPRGPLATPPSCGTHESSWEFTPWSGTAPVSGRAAMTIDQACAGGGFTPKVSGGSISPRAGAFSSFVTKLTRESHEQNIAAFEVTLPTGVLAKLRGVRRCEGIQAQRGDCPAASRIGRATIATGPGPSPLWLPQRDRDPIEVYLAGPYRGAPLSLVVNAPAQAGPFDLGDVVTRVAVRVNPQTARATAVTDPLPQFLEGVPITYRTIHAQLDRPRFALNPTSCAEKVLRAKFTSDQGANATSSTRFQVGGCRELGFRPRLSLRLKGKTNRGAHPRLRAVLRARKGDANISHVSVALPRSAFLDQAHIRTICTRVQFAAENCPKGSIYGRARAITPLLDKPLVGPVYLRSSKHVLPDLVLALKGEIDINAVGRIDSAKGGIRTTFATVPDAPVTKVVLNMQGGSKGLLVNSRNLCAAPARADVALEAHSGKARVLRPLLKDDCAKTNKRRRR